MRAATAVLAAAPGSASGPQPLQQPKIFDGASRYQREIRMLVPGKKGANDA